MMVLTVETCHVTVVQFCDKTDHRRIRTIRTGSPAFSAPSQACGFSPAFHGTVQLLIEVGAELGGVTGTQAIISHRRHIRVHR